MPFAVLPVMVLLMARTAAATGGPTPSVLAGAGALLLLLAALFVFSVRAYARLVREARAVSPSRGRKAAGLIVAAQLLILAGSFTGLSWQGLTLLLELLWMLFPFAWRYRPGRRGRG